jgi:hypothetical protein
MKALGVIVAAVTFLMSAPADGAAQSDLTGMWDLTVMTDQGGQTLTLNVVQDGQDLTATGDAGEFGQFEMKGTFDGFEVRFAWELDLQGTPLDIVFTGTLTDGVISGTADFGGMGQGDWSAKRAAD